MEKYYVIDDNELGYNILDLNEINRLAALAITLEPGELIITETEAYSLALEEYISLCDSNSLQESYTKINSNVFGKQMLYNTIDMMLIEKHFRNNGITNDSMQFYNDKCKEYQKSFEMSDYIKTREEGSKSL